MTASEKILVVGPSWVGDMVMAQTLFMLLKRQDQNTQIDVLAPDWSRSLLQRIPEVSHAIDMPFKHGEFNLKGRYQFGVQLRDQHYDRAIVLPHSWKSALIPFFARIPYRTGWRGEERWGLLNDLRHLNMAALPMVIQRYMTLGLPKHVPLPDSLPQPYLQVKAEDVATALHKHDITLGNKPVLVLCPGAEYGSAKRWPTRYFAQVAQEYLEQDWQVWILGSRKDTPMAQAIQQELSLTALDLTGKTSLAEAIDLLSLAAMVVTNDSGLMHVAAALRRPMVVMYGSSDPKYTPPLTDRVKTLSLELACSPCFKRECPLGHLRCLQDLHPTQTINAINELLGSCVS